MTNVEKLKREKAALVAEMRGIVSTAETRGEGALTADEETRFDTLSAAVEKKSAEITRAEVMANLEIADSKPVGSPEEAAQYRSMGEFVADVISSTAERRATTMGNPAQAGLLVPPEFVSGLRQVPEELTVVRNHATIIPSSEASPDTTTYVPVLNQFDDKGVYAGVTMNWTAETGTKQNAGDVAVNQVAFTPYNINGYIEVSNQMLDNYEAIGKYAQQLMSKAIANAEEKAFLMGTGVGQPTGFVGHPSAVSAPRTTAGQISYEDIVNMLTITLSGGSYVFLVSRSAMAQLYKLKDPAGNLIWNSNARSGAPGHLMGVPVYFTDRLAAVGTSGDIVLADLSHYGIKDGTGLTMFADMYTQADRGITRLFVNWRVDGRPLLLTPVKGNDLTARSAFVTLA